MDFLASPGAFLAWLVDIGAAEVARLFLVFLAVGAVRNWHVIRQKLAEHFSARHREQPAGAKATKPAKLLRTPAQRVEQRDSSGWLRRAAKRYRLWNNRWIRRYRFDEAWIQREVSRGHACFMIMLLWFGFWMLAMGLKEVFLLTEGPLSSSPRVALGAALPMYAFELAWLRFSGRAAQLIKYRNKVRIWRWWH